MSCAESTFSNYRKCRLKVKLWEDEFKKLNNRQPTKIDIKAASTRVREYYAMYWKLKTKLLEAEILGEPTYNENTNVRRHKSDNILKENTNILTENKSAHFKNALGNVLNKSDGLCPNASKENMLSPTEQPKSDAKAWGSHLNRTRTVSSRNHDKNQSFSFNISEKLFEGTKFKKRNPRKSFSFNKSKSNLSLTSCDDSSNVSSPNGSFQMEMSPAIDTQEDNSELSFSVENDCSPKIKALITSKVELSPLFTDKIQIASASQPTVNQPVSLIQKIVSEPTKVMKSVRKLDMKWLDRCNDANVSHEQRLSSDSGFESMESSLQLSSETYREESKKEDTSEDEIIGDSDNEHESSQHVFDFSILSQKRKSEVLNSSRHVEHMDSVAENIEPVAKKPKHDHYEFFPETVAPKKATKNFKEEILQNKIKQGTLNENFVKINLKKKVFVRGKKHFNFSKHKKQQWKNKTKDKDDREVGGVIRCFKCGEAGHFARYCQKIMQDKLRSDDEESEDDSGLPTLEEAESMAMEKADTVHVKKRNILLMPQPEQDEPELGKVEPLYDLNEDGSIISTPPEVFDALAKFGHYKFRAGQEETVMRILSGQSTLVTISTGGGKSLCYQLPAYMYATRRKCITLVVSPLVSLMEDQVSGSSSFFKVGCLHKNQTPKQREDVLEDVISGKLYALLLSPEAVVAGENSAGFGNILKQLPPIAFACIDEVHCVSQWSHNFRPSYLMISKVLKEKLGVKTILGLTATATKSTIAGIVKELGISDMAGVIKDNPLPDNLCLSVSRNANKDAALLELLKSPRFRDSNATLIYCTRRDECERLAKLIRTIHNDFARPESATSKRLSWNAESYHAGMSSARRKQVQRAFMRGNVRIVVATVAFGMGINKQDIRAVIHYNMPKDFESYVQEVGRAGRDGMLAHCHLFLDSKGDDNNELRRHIYSNSVDRHVIRKLLQRVFTECKCKKDECPGHEVAFDYSDTIQALDIPEENIYTLLCYLELHPKNLIKVLTPVYVNCKVQSYKGMKAINAAARKCPPLAMACAMNPDYAKQKSASLSFNVVELARTISWDSGVVKSQLKNCEWEKNKADKWTKTGLVIDYTGLGFRVCSRGDLTPSELDDALDYLIKRVENEEKRSAGQLDIVFSALSHYAVVGFKDCLEKFDKTKSDSLKFTIRRYFETEELPDDIPLKSLQEQEIDEAVVAADVRNLVCTYRDNTFNGRAVARIFHGIQSPNYPASVWFKCRYWRHHLDKDFNQISKIATREILRLK